MSVESNKKIARALVESLGSDRNDAPFGVAPRRGPMERDGEPGIVSRDRRHDQGPISRTYATLSAKLYPTDSKSLSLV